MKKNSFHNIFSLIVLFWLLMLVPCHSFAYLCADSDCKTLLEDADTICKIKVLSVKARGIYIDTHFSPILKTARMVARSETLSVIKGNPSRVIHVVFPLQTMSVGYTQLSPGEICLVFLKGNLSPFEFVDPHSDKLYVMPNIISYNLGTSPQDRLLAELLACVNSAEGMLRITAIEELGNLGDFRASKVLKKFSTSQDIVLRSECLTARVKVGDVPDIGELLSFLRINQTDFDTGDSLKKYETTGYSMSHLQSGLISAIEESVDYQKKGPTDLLGDRCAAKKLKEFDYIEFFRQALQCKNVAESEYNRRDVASALRKLANENSVPDLIKLLDDSDMDVRYYAATALARIYQKEGYFPSTDMFESDECRYISYWKSWWKEHGSNFMSVEK